MLFCSVDVSPFHLCRLSKALLELLASTSPLLLLRGGISLLTRPKFPPHQYVFRRSIILLCLALVWYNSKVFVQCTRIWLGLQLGGLASA
jgi:hypothetical protein